MITNKRKHILMVLIISRYKKCVQLVLLYDGRLSTRGDRPEGGVVFHGGICKKTTLYLRRIRRKSQNKNMWDNVDLLLKSFLFNKIQLK